jgi:hypothetical protein
MSWLTRGETSNTKFQRAEADQQPWDSKGAHNPVPDQYHDVDQMFRDAIDLSERIHDDAVRETSPTRGLSFHPHGPEEANIKRSE